MPLLPIQRLVSHTATVVGAADRETAVGQLLSGTAPNVIKTGNLYDKNNALARLFNDGSAFLPVPDPHIVKYAAANQADCSQGYAAQSHPINLDLSNNFLIVLMVFSTTELHTRVDVADLDTLNLLHSCPQPMNPGRKSLLIFSSLNADSHSRSQCLRSYTIPVVFDEAWTGLDVKFVFSFEPADERDPIPEGLAFIAEIYQSITL